MLEIKVTIEAPELAGAINNLSKSIGLAVASQTGNTAPADVNPADKNTQESRVECGNNTANVEVPVVQPNGSIPVNSGVHQNNAPVNTVPVAPTGTPTYTLDMIASAGAALVDAGKMDALCGLLEKYGVNVITALDASQYGAFAADLRALGAQI